ncbi:MAG: ankyrin repeat domain-containing protein, partial [Fusobacteriaceae bacterium]|nr:ankyrin repeat domain-containing protein [Fusobacteriaceae bacterium]
NIEAKDNYGWTPLMFAVNANSKEIIELLLKKGANKRVRDYKGQGLLEIAKSKEVKKFLISLGIKN